MIESDAGRFSPVRPPTAIRPDIQALRALAVGIVVVYHFWPERLPGGFVGVDVFFVISGFLITTHLVGEYDRTGRLDLPRFWARRARRLLPASLVVLGAITVASPLLLPGAQLQETFKQIVASTLYVQNWALAADSIDYLAAENVASPVQHFWSLSVEEQFYILVPVALLLAVALVRRRRAMLAVLGVVAAASFAYSIWETAATPGIAYFATTTRAWEFAAGGLLAFVAGTVARPRLRAAVAWVGWITIVGVAFAYTADTPFPGYTASLPVLGALAVVWAGTARVAWSPERFLAVRPVTFIGDISYSVYLWHWPILIFFAPQLWTVKLLLIAVILALAWASWAYVENPVRRVPIPRPRLAFAVLAAAMAAVIIPATLTWNHLSQKAATEVAIAQERAASEEACFGASAQPECAHEELVPHPSSAADDKAEPYADGCISRNAAPELRSCEYGAKGAATRVALVGDSHAVSWLPTLERIAREERWSITTYFKSGCPHSTARKINKDPTAEESCAVWNTALNRTLETSEPFDFVFVTHSAAGDSYESIEATISGFREAWRVFTSAGAKVVVIRDTPRMTDELLPCLEVNQQAPEVCAVSQKESLLSPDWMVEAAIGEQNVAVVDLSDVFCWDGSCKAAIGGVVVYRDHHHLTRTFAITLAPLLRTALHDLGVVA